MSLHQRATRPVLALVVALTAAPLLTAPVASAEKPEHPTPPAPVHRVNVAAEIPGRYIVVMDRRSDRADRVGLQRSAARTGGTVTREYDAALSGFAATLPAAAVETLRRDPAVEYIEPDVRVRVSGTQSGAPWGLDRVDQRALPLNRSYRYAGNGSGVTAYVIDTGIRKGHAQFGRRLASGFTAVPDGRGTNDCNGHGTHVAGTLGGKRFGVAKGVTVRPVRVLNCRGTGSMSRVLAGVDWVTEHHAPGQPAVANLSLGGGRSLALDQAVRNSIFDGVMYTVAAGNENRNACNVSPARVEPALTVGSTTRSDRRSPFSNKGPCVDMFAPGSDILSAWHTSKKATKTISGTSMAAPHVAGAAALMLQRNPAATPDLVTRSLLEATTTGVVGNRGTGSPNRLLYTRGKLIATPPPPPGNAIVNGGFEQGTVGWSGTPGVIHNGSSPPAHSGAWKAWLNGYGESRTDTLSQTVTVPSADQVLLSFYLWIVTEDDVDVAYDRLGVEVVAGGVTSQRAGYSNRDAGSSYVKRTVDLSGYAGQTVTVRFTGTEDSTLATHFLIDDVAIATG
jgi:subtilisin family serine protease